MLRIAETHIQAADDRSLMTLTLAWTPDAAVDGPLHAEVRGRSLKTILGNIWGDVTCSAPDSECAWRTPVEPTFNEVAKHNPKNAIVRWCVPHGIAKGETVTFTVNVTPVPIARGELYFHLVAEQGENLIVREPEVLQLIPSGPVAGFDCFARPALVKGKAVLTLVPVDANRFPTSMAAAPATITHDGEMLWQGELTETTTITVQAPKVDVARFKLAVATNAVETSRRVAISNPVRTAVGTRLPVLGEIHWHTDLSGDGMRPIRDAVRVSRDAFNLDFVAPGDHTPQGDKWKDTVAALEDANDPGLFTTLFGWESDSTTGHENFYFTAPDHPLLPGGKAGVSSGTPKQHTPALDACEAPFLAIPHHTNACSTAIKDDGSHYWNAFDWPEPRPKYRRLMEIMQTRGNFEREHPPAGWRCLFEDNGSSAQSALEAGNRIGFTGGTDNHTAWPTVHGHQSSSRLYTGVWTTARERQPLFDALYDRHTWACWDTRAIVQYEINGALQGSELTVMPGENLTAHIRLSLEAPLALLELVTKGDTATPVPFSPDALDLDIRHEMGVADATVWYYLRARQTDGAILYASPVFIDLAKGSTQ